MPVRIPTAQQRRKKLNAERKKRARQTVTIRIPMIPPTFNEWDRGRTKNAQIGRQARYKEDAYKALLVATANLKHPIPVPCIIRTIVYKKYPNRGDAQNLTTPVDKMFLDGLTSPRPPKKRGLGLLPDDRGRFCTVCTPICRKAHEGIEYTEMVFEPRKGSMGQ